MFLGTSRTDSNCYCDICPGNICLGHICPYQKYFSCYWPDFDQTLKVGSWDHLEQMPTVLETFVQATYVLATFVLEAYALATFVHISNISAVTGPILTKLFGPNFLGFIIFVGQNALGPNFFRPKFFSDKKFFRAQHFWTLNFIGRKKKFEPKIILNPKFSQTPNFFPDPNLFSIFFSDTKFICT